MIARTKVSEVIGCIARNFWVRFLFGLIGAIAAYLEFKAAGWTLLFWLLCSLTAIAILLAAIPLARKWILEQRAQWVERARLYYDHQHKVEMLTALIGEFATLEKAKCLADAVKDKENVQVLAILPVEERLGVILNVGKEENLQVGTRLLVYRMDEHTPDGQHIEQQLGLVQVTYVQAGNNCSQAIVVDPQDQEFWDQIKTRLERDKRIDPPNNFVVPYIPPELSNLSLEDLTTFRQYLETIRDSLTRTELDQIVQKEAIQ